MFGTLRNDSTMHNTNNQTIGSNNSTPHPNVDSPPAYFQDFSIPVKLPFRRNPKFCGRENTLDKIRKILESVDLAQQPNTLGTSERKTVVLHGMGGIGKSQIALEYAYRFRDCYTSILCINANDLSSNTESTCLIVQQLVAHYVSKSRSALDYQSISNILDIPGKIDSSGRIFHKDAEIAIEAVYIWLAMEKNREWLLIVDNYDEAQVEKLEGLIPACNWGSVLVTTRLATLHRFGNLVEVEKIGAEAGLELFLNSSGKHGEHLIDSELGEAKEIVIALGELPLALE